LKAIIRKALREFASKKLDRKEIPRSTDAFVEKLSHLVRQQVKTPDDVEKLADLILSLDDLNTD